MANKKIIDFSNHTAVIDTDTLLIWSEANQETRKVQAQTIKDYVAGNVELDAAGVNGSIQINTDGNLDAVTGFIWNSGDTRLDVPGGVQTDEHGNSAEWNIAHTDRITSKTGTTGQNLELVRPETSNISLQHKHEDLTTGEGLSGNVYDGSTSRQWNADMAWNAKYNSLSVGSPNHSLVISSAKDITARDATLRDITARDATLTRDAKSSPFVGGILGTGWRLQTEDANNNSFLEVDTLRVRKEFRTHIFRKEEVRAVNGRVYVTDASEAIETKTWAPGASSSLNIRKGPGYATFNENDEILIRNIAPDLTSINNITATVEDVINQGDYTELVLAQISGGTVYAGDTVVRISGGTILLDANAEGSPYLDVADDGDVRVRLGNLEDIGALGLSSKTWGLYAEGAVYLDIGTSNIFSIGRDIGGSGVNGIQLDANNYWYGNGQFKVSGAGGLLERTSAGDIRIESQQFDLDSSFELDAGEPDHREVRLRIRNVEDSSTALRLTTTPIAAGVPGTPIDKIVFTREGNATFAGDVDLDGDMTVNGFIKTEFDDGNFVRGVRIEDGQFITSLNGNDLGFIRTSGAEFRSGTAATSAKTTISTTAMIVDSNPTLSPENNPNYTGVSIATGIDVRQFGSALRPAHRNGRIIYNSTTNKYQGSVDGSWVDLH